MSFHERIRLAPSPHPHSRPSSLTPPPLSCLQLKCFQIELTKGYGYNEFREDLKRLFFISGDPHPTH